jgi:hypothetical protein
MVMRCGTSVFGVRRERLMPSQYGFRTTNTPVQCVQIGRGVTGERFLATRVHHNAPQLDSHCRFSDHKDHFISFCSHDKNTT